MRHDVYLFANHQLAEAFEEGFQAAYSETTHLRLFQVGEEVLGVVRNEEGLEPSRRANLARLANELMNLPRFPAPSGPAYEAMLQQMVSLYREWRAKTVTPMRW